MPFFKETIFSLFIWNSFFFIYTRFSFPLFGLTGLVFSQRHSICMMVILDFIFSSSRASHPSPFKQTHLASDRGSTLLSNHTQPSKSLFSFLPDLSGKPSPSTYRDLKRALDKARASPGEFSVCFTKLQQNFFNDHPRKLKDLILLVKDWYRQVRFILHYLWLASMSYWVTITCNPVKYNNLKSTARCILYVLSKTQEVASSPLPVKTPPNSPLS